MIPGSANPLLLKSAAAAAGGYQIERSLRFNSSDSGYLSRTPAVAGNRKTWTWAGWVKRGKLGGENQLFTAGSGNTFTYFSIGDNVADGLTFARYTGSHTFRVSTTQVLRDLSAWYHIFLAVDTSQATDTNRVKLYVNGIQVTVFTTASYPGQNTEYEINNTNDHRIGDRTGNYANSGQFDGYLADVYFIDGQALTPSSFTEVSATTGQLIPKAYTGSFGTNGFWLKFSDNSAATATTLGKDYSGNSNNWTPNNFSVTAGAGNDSLVDTPTSYGTDTGAGGEVRGNYCTLNPLNVQLGAGSLSNGNLDLTGPSGSSAYNYAGGTFGIDTSTLTGWYFEFTQTTYGQFASIGLLDQSVSASALNNLYIIGHSFANQTAGISYSNGGSIGNYGTLTTGLTSWTSSGDVIGVAIKDNKIWFAKNNTWISGSPSAGTSPSITLASTKYVTPAAIGINSSVLSLNAGQRPFAYTAPSGFKALCDTNLPAPVVAKPNTVMDVVLYSGTGSNQTITGLNFNPDFVWLKRRSSAQAHYLYDVIRGTSSVLYSDGTDAEQSISTGLTAFNSNGFSLGSLSGVNASSTTNVAWTWDAGTSTVTNTQGSISSGAQVRANPSSGFSVVTWVGDGTGTTRTVGHGLGVAPSLIIAKNRTSADGWPVYHKELGNSQIVYLNTTAAASTNTAVWNSTSPTSTVFSIGGTGLVNELNYNYVAYCFAPVAGYSNGFSYTGNGSTDGSFVYLGFRPRLILLKCSSTTGNWTLLDTAREGYNVDNDPLYPNLSNAEGTTDLLDITSNGFKLRTTDASVNSSGATYIGFAWAEAPFAYSRAR